MLISGWENFRTPGAVSYTQNILARCGRISEPKLQSSNIPVSKYDVIRKKAPISTVVADACYFEQVINPCGRPSKILGLYVPYS